MVGENNNNLSRIEGRDFLVTPFLFLKTPIPFPCINNVERNFKSSIRFGIT